jgi:hypothetical protein
MDLCFAQTAKHKSMLAMLAFKITTNDTREASNVRPIGKGRRLRMLFRRQGRMQ